MKYEEAIIRLAQVYGSLDAAKDAHKIVCIT